MLSKLNFTQMNVINFSKEENVIKDVNDGKLTLYTCSRLQTLQTFPNKLQTQKKSILAQLKYSHRINI